MEKTWRSALMLCPRCGHEYIPVTTNAAPTTNVSTGLNTSVSTGLNTSAVLANGIDCPLCAGLWEAWELLFSPIPLPKIREQVAAWLGSLPHPCVFEIGASSDGVRLRLFTPPGCGQGAVSAWAAMLHQQLRWKQIGEKMILTSGVLSRRVELVETLSKGAETKHGNSRTPTECEMLFPCNDPPDGG